MRRFIKKLIDSFMNWGRKMDWDERISFLLAGIVGIVICILSFLSIDKVPATSEDYLQLELYATNIQLNPSLLFETNCVIKNNDDAIIIRFENDECELSAKYDKELKLISTSRIDKSMFWLWALLSSILIGICAYGAGAFIFILIISLLEVYFGKGKLIFGKEHQT